MKLETKTRGIGLPGMEALSFTMLVDHGGVGVAAAGCGGKRCFFFFFSPLFRFASVFLCFFSFTLLSLFLSFIHSLLFFFVSVLLSLLSSLAAFFVSYAIPPYVFSSLCPPSPCFSSYLFDSFSDFYSQRMQVFFGNGRRASHWRGMSAARRAS
jgi:hypothetical protein